MVDALTAEIDRTQGERDTLWASAVKLQRQCEMLDVKLTALKLAADLRPLKGDIRTRADNASNKGRQAGAISRRWRRILVEAADAYPSGAEPDEIAVIAHRHGINIRDRDVNARCKRYEDQEIVESLSNGWKLRPVVLAKFKAENLELSDDGENDNIEDDEEKAA